MKKIRQKKYFLAALTMVACVFCAKLITRNITKLKAQEYKLSLAPTWTAQGLDIASQSLQTFKLADFKGKWVVLEWFNNSCPFVEKHYGSRNMQMLQEKYTKQDVVWLSIASSQEKKQGYLDLQKAKQVVADRKSQQTAIIFDASGNIARSYGATATPHMFVIDPNGNIIYQGAIDDNPSFRKTTIKGARNFVAQTLDMGLGVDPDHRKTIDISSYPVYGCSIKNDLTPNS